MEVFTCKLAQTKHFAVYFQAFNTSEELKYEIFSSERSP